MFLFDYLTQGSSQTEESSSQRTSSTVLAKEALIEIDYSNLSEDLKVGAAHVSHVYSATGPPARILFNHLQKRKFEEKGSV